LVLFLLVGFALISLSAGNHHENELVETEKTHMMELENIETLELAKPDTMPKKKKDKKKNKKKKNKKNKKKGNKKNKKGRNKKNKKGRNKKGRNKKNKKGRNKKGNSRGRSGTRANSACATNINKYLYYYANQVVNLGKQILRGDKHKNITGKKYGKKGDFLKPLSSVQDAAGSNLAAPKCGSNSTNDGAMKMKYILANLSACSGNIKKACSTDMPLAPNKTELASCHTKVKAYTAKMAANYKKTDLCGAFGDNDTKAKYNAVQACIVKNMTGNNMTIKKWQTAVTEAKKKCITAFVQCRKIEREVGPTIQTCSKSSNKILKSLKALTTNNKSATAVENKVKNITTKSGRHNRAVPTNCSTMEGVVTKFITTLQQNPEADLTSETNDIKNSTIKAGACSSNTKLTDGLTTLKAVITYLTSKITILQAELKTLTGNTASSSQIAAASTASSTVSGRKRRAALHKILNKVNMH